MKSGDSRRSVCFLIRSLERGGAERQLTLLAIALAKKGWRVSVLLFYGGGSFAAELVDSGVRLIALEKGGRWDVLPFLVRLVRRLRQESPAVLHSYLTVSNLLAALLKPLFPGTCIVWGVRASDMDLSRYDWLSRVSARAERWFAGMANMIISNSHAGKRHAVDHGFPSDRMVVIPNGIDTSRMVSSAAARQRMRAAWGVAEDEILIGLSARVDPVKGHDIFLQAAALLANAFPQVRFVCVGEGPADFLLQLREQARQAGLGERLVWAGVHSNMAAVYSALDIATSTSISEGFSNSIAEAMACSVPCVVTDVGDSAFIVGETGVVVPAHDPGKLAEGWRFLLELPAIERTAWGARACQRVVANFSVDAMVDATEKVLSAGPCDAARS